MSSDPRRECDAPFTRASLPRKDWKCPPSILSTPSEKPARPSSPANGRKWRVLPTLYEDDGGYSGGSMERPALRRLLEDVENRQVDTIVVYKVDRLTRSLADFAKTLSSRCARSFLRSVTQQFNTTTSMGRLTLNVLLSFAQFEREVTGKIRDKIAASKRKGMWMGGRVP